MTPRVIPIWPFLWSLLCAWAGTAHAQQPAWTANPAEYQFSMNVIAQVRVNGQPNHTTGNSLAAFHQGVVHGVATPIIISNQAYYFLTVFSNHYVGDSIGFKAFLLLQNQVYESTDTLIFYHQNVLGSLPAPFPLNFVPSEKPFIYSPATAVFIENSCVDTLLDVQAGDNLNSEGNGLSYSITGGADGSKFSIAAQTGILSWHNFVPDFENPGDANTDNRYEVQVTVSDPSGNTDVQTVRVTVLDNLPALATCSPGKIAYTGDDGPGNCSTTVLGTGLLNAGSACSSAYGYTLSGATSGSGAGAVPNNQAFSAGLTTVTYTVTDGEPGGSSAQCSFTVTVSDNDPPSLTCPGNLTVSPTIQTPCSAVVNGINATYSDNCSGDILLSYTHSGANTGSGSGQLSGPTFLTGLTTVTYTATDGAGQHASCSFTVTVSGCNTVFSGRVIWEQDGTSGVQTTTVTLSGSGTGSAITNVSGNYQITLAPVTGNFVLKPAKNINKTNGLSSADATAIQQHLSNAALLPAPFKRIAADVNKSNSITTLDATLITQALQGNQAALNQITSWRFVPAAFVFPNPNVPWGFPEQIDLTGVSGIVSGQDFKGIKLGDVVSTWANPANFGAGEPLVLRVQDRVLRAGSDVTAEFRADQLDDVNSFQFALYFDPEQLQLVEIEPLAGLPVSMADLGTYNLAEGEIRVVWAQATPVLVAEAAPVFRLRFKALESGARLSEVLHLNDDALPGHVYNSQYAESGVELRFTTGTGTGQGADEPALLLDNRPNPFKEETAIRFVLAQAGEAELRVSDAAGRLLYTQKKHYAAGPQEETLRLDGAAGILFAELVTEQGSVLRKMLALR